MLGTILSEHKKMSEHKKELCTINMTGTSLVICWVWTAALRMTNANLQWSLPAHEGRSWVLHWVCLELYSMCKLPKNRVNCWEHELSSDLHFNPVKLRICCKIVKLAGSILKARAGHSACCLSSFFQWQPEMMSSPFAKVEEMEKTFRDKWISNQDVLSFCYSLESHLKRKNMCEQLYSGK